MNNNLNEMKSVHVHTLAFKTLAHSLTVPDDYHASEKKEKRKTTMARMRCVDDASASASLPFLIARQ